ncbi:MAG: response regulator [Pirellulaceae bacterium]
MSESILYIVDDDPAARDSLSMLARSAGYRAVAIGSAEEFLSQYQSNFPACVILDIRLPGMNGLELHRRLRMSGHSLEVIYLTAHADVPSTVQAMKLGAFELFQKPCNTTRLLEAIHAAVEKNQGEFESVLRRQKAEQLLEPLSEEERKVLELIFSGRTNQEIADALQLSLRTVQFRRSSIFRKMNVESKAQLFDILFQAGWSPRPEIIATAPASNGNNA